MAFSILWAGKQEALRHSMACVTQTSDTANLQRTSQFPEEFGHLPGEKYQRTFGYCLYGKERAASRHLRANLSLLGVVRLLVLLAGLYRQSLTWLCRWWAVWRGCPEHPALLQRLPFHCSQNNVFLAINATISLTCFFFGLKPLSLQKTAGYKQPTSFWKERVRSAIGSNR